MAKLVVLSEALIGQTYELKVDRTTVGRVEDNTFQIAQPSVSSHHCEILLRGTEVVVKDLNSTNGTFIDEKQVTSEAVLKPGQTLRLGEIKLKLDSGDGAVVAEPLPAAAPRRPTQTQGSTMVINKGVGVDQLGNQSGTAQTQKGDFQPKKNTTNRVFIVVAVVLLLVILVAVFMVINSLGSKTGGH